MNMETEIKKIIADSLKVPRETITGDLCIGDIPQWDSLGHMTLMTALANHFCITFQREEMTDLEDVSDIIALVTEKATQ